MIYLIDKNGEYIRSDSLFDRFKTFFGQYYDKTSEKEYLLWLNKNNYVFFEGDFVKTSSDGKEKGLEWHIEYYFSEGVRIGAESNAEKLYQMGGNIVYVNDSIIDTDQLEYIEGELSKSKGTIVDLGCGKGGITSYISNKTNRETIGIDKSKNMIEIAQKNKNNISWIKGDFANTEFKNIGAFLLIDSIYFVKDRKSFISNLLKQLSDNGIIIFTYSEYFKNSVPLVNSMDIMLKELGINWNVKEFTENEKKIWEVRLNYAAIRNMT